MKVPSRAEDHFGPRAGGVPYGICHFDASLRSPEGAVAIRSLIAERAVEVSERSAACGGAPRSESLISMIAGGNHTYTNRIQRLERRAAAA